MHEPAPGGVEETLPEFSDPYTDLAIEASTRADSLSWVLVTLFALILLVGVLNLIRLARVPR